MAKSRTTYYKKKNDNKSKKNNVNEKKGPEKIKEKEKKVETKTLKEVKEVKEVKVKKNQVESPEIKELRESLKKVKEVKPPKEKKKKNKVYKYVLLGILLLGLSLVLGEAIILNHYSNNENLLATKDSLVTLQNKYEDEYKVDGYTFDNPNVIVDPYKASPLTALVLFKTDDEVSIKVTIAGKDMNTTYTHEFKASKNHYLPIYGLYPDYDNIVKLEYSSNGENFVKELSIKTDKLPDGFILPTKVMADKSELEDELYFYTPSSMGYTCAYDVNGDVRWYLSNYALWNIERLKNGHLLISTERLVNSPYYMTGLYEIDMLGKIYNEYSLPGGYHHDYYEMANGNFLVASDDFNNDDGTVEDYIVEIDRNSGKIVKTFDLKDVLKMDDGKSENWIDYDWFHNNAVWYDEKTNSVTLSGRHQDAVINLSYETGELNWIIGDPEGWSEEYQKYFFKPVGDNFEWQWSQHAAMITPEGYVFVFDNGNNKSKSKDRYVKATKSYSRGVMYKIDNEAKTIEQVWQYGKERGSSFYSPYISDVDYLEENHYIVHSGGIVYVDGKNSNYPAGLGGADKLVTDTVELKNDNIIFELVLPTNNYRVEKMDLYDASDDEFYFGKASRIGSLGKTPVESTKLGFITKANAIDEEYEKHNITLTKEEDRFGLSGRFLKGTSLKIILYKNDLIRTYYVSVSKRPYTALCVDVFTEEETKEGININTYINKDGLKGKYSVYIEIEGKLYDTEQYIEF